MTSQLPLSTLPKVRMAYRLSPYPSQHHHHHLPQHNQLTSSPYFPALHTIIIEFYSPWLDITSLLSITLDAINCENAHCIDLVLALQTLQQTPKIRSLRPTLNLFHHHPAQLLLVPATPLITSIRSTTHSLSSPTRSSSLLATHQLKPRGSHYFPQSHPSRLPHCPEQAQPATTGPTLYDLDL